MVAKVGVQLLRKLQKQLKNIEKIAEKTPAEEKPQLRELYAEVRDKAKEVEEKVKTIPEPSLEEKRQQLRGYTSPQRTEVNYYETLLNKLRSKYKSELPLGSGAIAFNDLPKAEQDRLYRGGFAKPGDMITIPSVVERGKTARKILGQRLKALEEQEAKDLSEVSPALEKIPVFERAARFDYETYDPQIGPTRRDAFKDRYKVQIHMYLIMD